jgi:hypothetical protein
MLCFVSFVVTFVSTRAITRLIRDGRGPFRNVRPAGRMFTIACPGLFLPPVGFIGAVRLARPNSIWARRL